jgi:hypothetical protein
VDYKRAGQEAREGGMSFKDGGSVSKPKRSAPEERAAEVGMERQEKTFAKLISVTMIQRKNGKVAELLAKRWLRRI